MYASKWLYNCIFCVLYTDSIGSFYVDAGNRLEESVEQENSRGDSASSASNREIARDRGKILQELTLKLAGVSIYYPLEKMEA